MPQVQCFSLFYSYMLGVGLAHSELVLVMVLQAFLMPADKLWDCERNL